LIRNTIGTIGNLFNGAGLIVGVIAIHASNKNQRIGDNLAGTVVISNRKRDRETDE